MSQTSVPSRIGVCGLLVVAGLLAGGAGGAAAWAQGGAATQPAAKGEVKEPKEGITKNVQAKEPAKDAGKPEGKGDAAKGDLDIDKDKPVVLKALPMNIQISGNVQFNENGVMSGQSTYFNVSFFLQPPGNMPIRSIRNVKVVKLVTDSGEDLTQGLRDQSGESFQMPEDLFLAPGQDRNRGRSRRQMYITPPFPKKPCRKIAKLQGTADIELAQGPLKRVNIGAVSAVDGKRIKIEGIDDAWVQFSLADEGNQRRMQVTSNAATLGKIARMYFFNGDGTLIQNQGYSSGYSGQGSGTVTLGLYGQFPENTTAVLIIYGKSKSMSVTFEGTDFPMPSIFAEGSDLFDMVMKTEAIEDGFALADIAPKPVPVDKNAKPAAVKPGVAKGTDGEGDVVGAVPSDISKMDVATFTQEDAPVDPNKPVKKKAVKEKAPVEAVKDAKAKVGEKAEAEKAAAAKEQAAKEAAIAKEKAAAEAAKQGK
jgi:hypothetical protein